MFLWYMMVPYISIWTVTVALIVVCFAGFHFWMFYGFTQERRKITQLGRLLPGPTAFPIVGNIYKAFGNTDEILEKVMQIVDENPCPMRLWAGPTPIFIFDDPKDIEVIMTHPKSQTKDKLYKLFELYIGKGLITSAGDYWRRHRKIILPTLHISVLETFVDTFVENSEVLVEVLSKEVGKSSFDIMKYLHHCSLDLVCETLMGYKMNTQNGDNFEYMDAIHSLYGIGYLRLFNFWLHPEWILRRTSVGKKFFKSLDIVLDFSTKMIQQKKQEYAERKKELDSCEIFDDGSTKKRRKVFIDLMLELTDKDMLLTDGELREEVDTLMTAALDTTATVSSFTCLMLAIHQDCQMKAYKELENIFGDSDRPPTPSDLQRMNYMEMVLKETLRLYPIGPILMRQLEGDIKMRDFVLPSGSSVAVFLYRTQRNPQFFPDPEKFDPNRFLPENAVNHVPYSYLPFSGGPRKCIGQAYGMMALKTLISAILRKYKLLTDMRMKDVKVKGEISVHIIGGYYVRLQKREDDCM